MSKATAETWFKIAEYIYTGRALCLCFAAIYAEGHGEISHAQRYAAIREIAEEVKRQYPDSYQREDGIRVSNYDGAGLYLWPRSKEGSVKRIQFCTQQIKKLTREARRGR